IDFSCWNHRADSPEFLKLLTVLEKRLTAPASETSKKEVDNVEAVAPPTAYQAHPVTSARLTTSPLRTWSRGEKLALAAVAIALVGRPGVYLAVPGVAQYIQKNISARGRAHETQPQQAVAPQGRPETPSSAVGEQPPPQPGNTSQIFVKTSVYPVR